MGVAGEGGRGQLLGPTGYGAERHNWGSIEGFQAE